MIDFNYNTKYRIDYTNTFKRNMRKINKQGNDIILISNIITRLANKETLDYRYRNHKLVDDKYYKDCYECHIKPDLILVYKYIDDHLVLLLLSIGSHSEVLNK